MTTKETVTLSGTQYTPSVRMRGRNQLGIHNSWTGNPTTAVTLWCSDEDKPGLADDTDWVEVTDVTIDDPAGSAGKFATVVGNATHLWYRQKLVTSGGAGTFTSRVTQVAAATA